MTIELNNFLRQVAGIEPCHGDGDCPSVDLFWLADVSRGCPAGAGPNFDSQGFGGLVFS